jgi:hypothetical protein
VKAELNGNGHGIFAGTNFKYFEDTEENLSHIATASYRTEIRSGNLKPDTLQLI